MRKDDLIRRMHMHDAACEAIEFTRSRDRSGLETDRILVLALVKDVEIIGEAASQVSTETPSNLPDIPWAEIVGM